MVRARRARGVVVFKVSVAAHLSNRNGACKLHRILSLSITCAGSTVGSCSGGRVNKPGLVGGPASPAPLPKLLVRRLDGGFCMLYAMHGCWTVRSFAEIVPLPETSPFMLAALPVLALQFFKP